MVAFGTLEILFIILVAAMTGAAGLFSLYVLLNQFRNTGRDRSTTKR